MILVLVLLLVQWEFKTAAFDRKSMEYVMKWIISDKSLYMSEETVVVYSALVEYENIIYNHNLRVLDHTHKIPSE